MISVSFTTFFFIGDFCEGILEDMKAVGVFLAIGRIRLPDDSLVGKFYSSMISFCLCYDSWWLPENWD
jgi:hypothetical protein